jgi:hypothetical protein
MNFNPHDYQAYAIRYIEKHPVAAVLLDMGLGKTIISLTAVYDLLFDSFEVHRVLVVAPLRVARDTWPAEIQKWEHLRGLTYAVAVGTPKERKAALMQQADITIINRENLQWLIDESGFPFDFDMVIIDELSSFKNHKSKRFKSLMKVTADGFIGLSGSQALLPPTVSWICGQSLKCWIWASASDALSHSTGQITSCQTRETARSSTPTSHCPMRRTPSIGGSRISRFP